MFKQFFKNFAGVIADVFPKSDTLLSAASKDTDKASDLLGAVVKYSFYFLATCLVLWVSLIFIAGFMTHTARSEEFMVELINLLRQIILLLISSFTGSATLKTITIMAASKVTAPKVMRTHGNRKSDDLSAGSTQLDRTEQSNHSDDDISINQDQKPETNKRRRLFIKKNKL